MSTSSSSSSKVTKPANRRRSSSVTSALKQIPLNHHQSNAPLTPTDEVKPLSGPIKPRGQKRGAHSLPENYKSLGFKQDIRTGRWLLVPSSSFLLLLIPALLCFNQSNLINLGLMGSHPIMNINPFEWLLFPSHRLSNGKYAKGPADFLFIAYYIIFWSFVRQFVTIYLLRPLGFWLGVRNSKIMRFTEQGYAVFYFSITGIFGIWVMSGLPIWWYKTEHFWLGYPHTEMTLGLKTYYLMQAAYWCQQTIILALKVEKPRKDFNELIAHHLVTLWLIGWSYGLSLTYIGVSIFITMDISDVFLGLAKCINYFNDTASIPFFAFFIVVWTYMRHYLNIIVLWSVYTEFDLIPYEERKAFRPLEDKWMTWWMKWQIFTPLFLLQLINLFWYALIWRILIRSVFFNDPRDERSDDEDEGDDGAEPSTEDKARELKGEKAQ